MRRFLKNCPLLLPMGEEKERGEVLPTPREEGRLLFKTARRKRGRFGQEKGYYRL